MSRPHTEESLLAEEFGIKNTRPSRTIRNLGGADKLRGLGESPRNLLTKKLLPAKKWGLEARGMQVTKPWAADEKFEAYVQELLQERGLVK